MSRNERAMRRPITLVVGTLLSAVGFAAQAQIPPSQAVQAANAARKAASPVAQAQQPAAQVPKPATRPAVKPPTPKRAAKPASNEASAARTSNPATAPEGPAASEAKVVRRDPFESLLGREKADAEKYRNLPPGKAGLMVASLRLDGIVRAPNGMIAVVTNPQARTYFLREGDQLYDGRVDKIAMDSVSFHEIGKDAFGKPVERQVNKRIYSSAGEQQ